MPHGFCIAIDNRVTVPARRHPIRFARSTPRSQPYEQREYPSQCNRLPTDYTSIKPRIRQFQAHQKSIAEPHPEPGAIPRLHLEFQQVLCDNSAQLRRETYFNPLLNFSPLALARQGKRIICHQLLPERLPTLWRVGKSRINSTP